MIHLYWLQRYAGDGKTQNALGLSRGEERPMLDDARKDFIKAHGDNKCIIHCYRLGWFGWKHIGEL